MSFDLVSFEQKHRELFAQAVQDGNYTPVTLNYYSVQAKGLTLGIGKYWHFVPHDPKLSREDNFNVLNDNFRQNLKLKPGDTLCEIGCGFCRTGREVARLAGANFVGVTLSPEEVELGNAEVRQLGLEKTSKVVRGDYTEMPMVDGKCDALLAVYTLKYSVAGGKLNTAFTEIARVLKQGGRFVSYEILTTDTYDEKNSSHYGWAHNISYHTGMPPLANVRNYREDAPARGLKLVKEYDLQKRGEGIQRIDESWPLTLYSPNVRPLFQFGDLFKSGVLNYYHQFVEHPMTDFIESSKYAVVTSSTIFAYERV